MFQDKSLAARPRKLTAAALATGLYATGMLATGVLALECAPALADPTSPTGIWYTDGDESIIKVHSCAQDAATFCGTLVWLKEPTEADGTPKVDKLNKDPAKKNKPMVGLDILLNMKSDDDHWAGKAYNPEDGKFYDITFKVKTDKEENDQADLRGCLLRFLCKTETFNRAKDVPGGDPTASADATPGKKKKPKRESAHR